MEQKTEDTKITLSKSTEKALEDIKETSFSKYLKLSYHLREPELSYTERLITYKDGYVWMVGREIFRYKLWQEDGDYETGYRVVKYSDYGADDFGVFSSEDKAEEICDELKRVYKARDILSGFYDNGYFEWKIKVIPASEKDWEDFDKCWDDW